VPDLATHLATGYLVAETRQGVSREAKTLFLVGNLLPDLLTRPFYTFFPGLYWAFAPLHTPVGLVLACSVASCAFEKRLRGAAFRALALGAALHLLLDALQKRVVDTYGILFPFAWKDVYVGLFWPDESLYVLPVLVVAILAREAVRHSRSQIPSPEL
jgi:hypothetical protein